MMSYIPLLLVGILFPVIQAKQLTKCELFQKLKDIDGYRGITLPEWICTIFHNSGFDTQTKINNNGSTEYGLFQISNKCWCRDHQMPQSRNICNTTCNKFLDSDLSDDITCVKKILDIEGIGYCPFGDDASWKFELHSSWPTNPVTIYITRSAHKPLCSDKLEQWLCKTS